MRQFNFNSEGFYKIITKLALGFLVVVVVYSIPNLAYAQTKSPSTADPSTQTILVSDLQELSTINGKRIRKHTGNVVLTQPDKIWYCNEAIEYLDENRMVCRGNLRIIQTDGQGQLSGDSLLYDKTNKLATVMGNVVLVDKGSTLTTSELKLNVFNNQVFYEKGATIKDEKSTLTSTSGTLDRNTNVSHFVGNVKLQGENSTLNTDSLDYNTETKMAYFFGPTKIISTDGTIRSTRGKYNTETGISQFDKPTDIETEDYILTGDIVDYSKAHKKGYAKGNVILFAKKDSITITGGQARYDGKAGYAKVWEKAVLKAPSKDSKDTLYLSADTLLSTGSNTKDKRFLYAYPKAQIFKDDFQGVADSLVYQLSDSLLVMYHNPVLWNKGNQLTSDTIRIQMANNALNKMYMRQNAFIISKDTIGNYNQVKGKNMLAYFNKGKLKKVDVTGNGTSLYFALEGDTALSGMNKVLSSNISILFSDSSKLERIVFINQPEGEFIPPKEILEPEKKLKGFSWQQNRRPTLASILNRISLPIVSAKDLKLKPKNKRKIKVKTKHSLAPKPQKLTTKQSKLTTKTK